MHSSFPPVVTRVYQTALWLVLLEPEQSGNVFERALIPRRTMVNLAAVISECLLHLSPLLRDGMTGHHCLDHQCINELDDYDTY